MKKILLLEALTLVVCLNNVHAQSAYNAHYYASPSGANGFRSVSEENAHMEQVVAEMKKKERREEMMPEEAKQQPGRIAYNDNKMIAQAGSRPTNKARK